MVYAKCPNLERNLAECTCTYTSCDKRGRCCECISFHRARGEAPGCLFPPEIERTYDRSLARLIEAYSNRRRI